jgi:hypothetical protein
MGSLITLLARESDEATLALVLLILVIWALFAVSALNTRKETEERIRSFAASLRGSVLPGTYLELPTIGLEIRGRSAWMDFSSERQPLTRLRVRIPQFTEGTLRIVRDSTSRTFLDFLGERSCKVGDRLFDTHYRVEADPVALVRRIFTPERMGEVVETVRRLNRCHGFSLTLEPGWLEIRVQECLKDLPVVLGMQRTASEFVGYLLGGGDPGMEWGEVVERMAGLCPICTTALREPLVRCLRCRSPHHAECWDYLGRCATFGCEPSPRRRAG